MGLQYLSHKVPLRSSDKSLSVADERLSSGEGEKETVKCFLNIKHHLLTALNMPMERKDALFPARNSAMVTMLCHC